MNWCFCAVMLEKTLESLLDCGELKPVNPKGNQSWIFIRRTDAEAEPPTLWAPNAKSQLIRKDPDAGEGWRQEKKGWQRRRWLDGIPDSVDMSLSMRWWRTGKSGLLQSMGSQRVGHNWMTEQLSTAPIKQIANKDLLYSTGNPSQYSILNTPIWGKNLKKSGYVCVCIYI